MEETLKSPTEQAIEIDRKKRALEAHAQVRFRRIFNNMANDVSSLLLSTQNINSKEIAENYKPDFIGALRDTYRQTIKTFGFSLRETAKKDFNIDFEVKERLLDIKQDFEVTPSQEQQINREFLTATTLFINNQSEQQADKITQTNAKEIETNVVKATSEYNMILANNLSQQSELSQQLSNISVAILLGISTEKDKLKIQRQITRLVSQERILKDNKNPIISRNFKRSFKDRGRTRSSTISEFEVGQTESFVRQTEAETLDNVVISGMTLNTVKNWDATLDGKTRNAHVIADATYHFNPIPVNEFFFVGGERLRYPRDPNGSAGNIINCRCVSIYSFV
jgi:hypothetical protein